MSILHGELLTINLPMEVRPSFNDQFSKFRKQCPDNVRPPATFLFLAQFVDELEKNYRSTPFFYDLDLTPSNVGVNVVRQGTSKPKLQPAPCVRLWGLQTIIFPSANPVAQAS